METLTRAMSLSTAAVAAGWISLSLGVPLHAQPPATPTAAQDPCAAPANTIVAENCRPGNPREEWDVNAEGDPEIQGFATEMSVNLGETVEFKIKTHSPRYRIDIYRMGWYGGSGARLVETIQPSVPLPQAQPDCRVHTRMRFVDCGNWQVSASWNAAITIWGIGLAMALSGAVFARLRPLWYFGLTAAAYPIGWVVFHVLMLVMYFGVITACGILLQMFGHDGLQLRRAPAGESYWKPRPPAPATARYFRQY